MEQVVLRRVSPCAITYTAVIAFSVLDVIPDNSVDLIYIDPPFYSQRSYEMIWGEDAERFAFAGPLARRNQPLHKPTCLSRVRKMHRKLKDGGSFYLHLDWHICHYMEAVAPALPFQNSLAFLTPMLICGHERLTERRD